MAQSFYLLGGDIGGTNTRLQLYQLECNGPVALIQGHQAPGKRVYGKWYANASFDTFVDIVAQFFVDICQDPKAECKVTSRDVEVACLAVAGPVTHNSVNFTNRKGWFLKGDDLSQCLGIKKVQLINDFVAQGYGLLSLNTKTECYCLHEAETNHEAPIACIGAGTGLGECFLTPSSDGSYQCFPTEGGHAEFAPRTDKDIHLLEFMRKKFASKHRISCERIISGPGIANLYEFLADYEPAKVDQAFHQKFLAAGDLQGKVVADNASSCTLCNEAMEIFATSYGSEAGVAGLKWMPFGGLYITGGLTPKNLERIKDPKGGFMGAYYDKGRVAGFLQDVPMWAVLVEDLGERGAHWKAVAMLRELHSSLLESPSTNGAATKSWVAPMTLAAIGLAVGAAVGSQLARR